MRACAQQDEQLVLDGSAKCRVTGTLHSRHDFIIGRTSALADMIAIFMGNFRTHGRQTAAGRRQASELDMPRD